LIFLAGNGLITTSNQSLRPIYRVHAPASELTRYRIQTAPASPLVLPCLNFFKETCQIKIPASLRRSTPLPHGVCTP
jgi:hypothetical protein